MCWRRGHAVDSINNYKGLLEFKENKQSESVIGTGLVSGHWMLLENKAMVQSSNRFGKLRRPLTKPLDNSLPYIVYRETMIKLREKLLKYKRKCAKTECRCSDCIFVCLFISAEAENIIRNTFTAVFYKYLSITFYVF